MPQQLTSIEVSRAVTLLEEGYSQRYVAQQLGVVQGTVWKLWKRYRETGTVTRRAGTGRQRKTTAGDERFLRLQALRNRTHTARDLQEDLLRARETRISDQPSAIG
jgi:transposase